MDLSTVIEIDEKKNTKFLPKVDLGKKVVESKPKWDDSTFFDYEVEGIAYYIFASGDMEGLINNKFSHTNTKATFLIKKTPFAKGAFSLAYYCKAKDNHSGNYYPMVLKQTMEHNEKSYYFNSLKKNTLAIYLAKEYNQALTKSGFSKKMLLFFTRVLVVCIGNQYYWLEAFIPGTFDKYTNNDGYVNESVPFMTAFSHFSYQFSKVKLMVTDLQGHNNLLTDPVIHSEDVQFRKQGDFGLKGMCTFFRHHRCNNYCNKLGLAPHKAQKDPLPICTDPVNFDVSNYYKKCNYYFCNNHAEGSSLCTTCAKNIDATKFW